MFCPPFWRGSLLAEVSWCAAGAHVRQYVSWGVNDRCQWVGWRPLLFLWGLSAHDECQTETRRFTECRCSVGRCPIPYVVCSEKITGLFCCRSVQLNHMVGDVLTAQKAAVGAVVCTI